MRAGRLVVMVLSAGMLAGMSVPAVAPAAPAGSRSSCPLTGKRAPAGVDVGRAAVAMKIDNGPTAQAPAGLNKADVVFESLVEGGITRFTAVFHCKNATSVGPVRSARADDPGFVKPLTRVLAYSGANAHVVGELRSSGMVSITEANASDAFTRSGSTLMGDTSRVRAAGQDAGVSSPPGLKFGRRQRGKAARVVKLDFGGTDVKYRCKNSAWRRIQDGSPFTLANGKQATTKNVLVWEVDVDDSTTVFDSVGTPSPELTLEGSGRAFLFRNGRVVKGTWSKAGAGELPIFKTKAGKKFSFAKGQTWIELVPSDAGDVMGSVSFR